MYLPKYAAGELIHPYKMAMRLSTDHFADTSSFESIKSRAFTIYRWKCELEVGIQKYSGFIPWLHYFRKWERFGTMTSTIPEKSINGKPMVPMHWYFKDLDDFKFWLGDDGFRDLLVNLL